MKAVTGSLLHLWFPTRAAENHCSTTDPQTAAESFEKLLYSSLMPAHSLSLSLSLSLALSNRYKKVWEQLGSHFLKMFLTFPTDIYDFLNPLCGCRMHSRKGREKGEEKEVITVSSSHTSCSNESQIIWQPIVILLQRRNSNSSSATYIRSTLLIRAEADYDLQIADYRTCQHTMSFIYERQICPIPMDTA